QNFESVHRKALAPEVGAVGAERTTERRREAVLLGPQFVITMRAGAKQRLVADKGEQRDLEVAQQQQRTIVITVCWCITLGALLLNRSGINVEGVERL